MHHSDALPALIAWGEQQPLICAMLLTSTRAVPGATVDVLSDYDVVLVVTTIRPFAEDRRWIEAFGEPLVSYWDAVQADAQYASSSSATSSSMPMASSLILRSGR